MKYSESLLWILDKDCKAGWNEEQCKHNIEFVHSLGLKCDSVGWSELDLSSPRAPEILDSISRFCKENGWGARGWYTRTFAETESTWYTLRFTDAADGFWDSESTTLSDSGVPVDIFTLNAYRELSVSPKEFCELKLVPDRFRIACQKLGTDDVIFCWAKDKGKYQAQQYFHISPCHAVKHLATDNHFCYTSKIPSSPASSQYHRMKELGGALPRLAEVFYELHIRLPNIYLASELPDCGFSSAFLPSSKLQSGMQNILIHKDTAFLLMQENALSPRDILPVPVTDKFPAGYEILDVFHQEPPAEDFRNNRLREYEIQKAHPRPLYLLSEKQALSLLRKEKRLRKEVFQKGLSKQHTAELSESPYAPLLPFYRISNGGYLSGEYEFLSFEQSIEETAAFHSALSSEELLTEKPAGILFAKCPDGDAILLCPDSSVLRFSHEAPEITARWPNLACFIVDALNEPE